MLGCIYWHYGNSQLSTGDDVIIMLDDPAYTGRVGKVLRILQDDRVVLDLQGNEVAISRTFVARRKQGGGNCCGCL